MSEEDKATIQRRINEWAKDKEFAEQVEDEMALIVAGCNQRNQPIPHIDEVYSKACRMNEEVSKILDQRIGADKDASKAEEAKAKAIKAKKGKINRKSVKKRTEKKPASLSDELRAGLERAEAGG